MVRVRGIQESDLPEVRALANLCLSRDSISDSSIRRITFGDPNFSTDLTAVATEDGKTVGFVIGVRRTKSPKEVVEAQKDVGWIKLFCVSEKHRRKGIGSLMLQELEEKFKAAGVERLRLCDYPGWTLFSGVDLMYEDAIAFLQAKGFQKAGEAVDYEIDLLDFHVPRTVASLRTEGVTVRRARPEERDRFSKWATDVFSPFWGYEVSEAFKFPQPKLWIAEEEERVLGFSVYSALEPHWFGPIGVDPDSRKKGLGSLLLFNSLVSMREEGQRLAVIPWTEHLFFYSQVPGVRRIRHYWIMQKSLS
jgi:GNAT superfamily N-acetyltransferase